MPYGIEYLRKKLESKRTRVLTRYLYYDMKNSVKYNGGVIPEKFQWMVSTLGWCGKAVDSIADRLCFREFENDLFEINEIYNLNNADVIFDSAILGALISSCDFIYISKDADGYPRLQVIDGGNATGTMDPITGLLTEGYAVLERSENGNPSVEAYFTAAETVIYENNKIVMRSANPARYALLVPIVYRPDAMRDFGHSRISRAAMSYTQSALRTILRSEVAAEFYSYPQKYILGMSQDADQMDNWKATIASILRIDQDENGNHPVVGQFQQQTMTPHIEQLRMFASLFAGETGLTLDDLGFVHDNPSSAEAIKASHENLRLSARKAQKCFGKGFRDAGFLAACVRDDKPYYRYELYETKAKWEPIFEPDMSTLSLIGDGAIKINQAIPGYIDKNVMRDMTGIEGGE